MQSLEEIIVNSPVQVYPDRYAVLQCSDKPQTRAFMVTDDGQEITAIVKEADLDKFDYREIEKWFVLFGIQVSVPFQGPGFLAAIAEKIAQADINILIVSTFSQDFILLREKDAGHGTRILQKMGFTINAV